MTVSCTTINMVPRHDRRLFHGVVTFSPSVIALRPWLPDVQHLDSVFAPFPPVLHLPYTLHQPAVECTLLPA